MLTNIYRIGGLQQVSWFQLIPDAERISPSTSKKDRGRQDAATMEVIMAHMRLQDDGHLSAWTVSSQKEASLQRTSPPDCKVKLWLFLPGLHDSISSSVHPMMNGLKVAGAGLWRAPGDNEEVGGAFCEALRNRLERALRGLSYARFGDVFVKCRRHGVLESRKVLPTCELMFMGSEEALFVHVIVRRKRVRLLAATDMQSALGQRSRDDHPERNLAVVVAPYGSCGRLSGRCPGDLVSQLYSSKLQAFTASSLPFRVVSSSMNGGGAVQSCYAEVLVGQAQGETDQRGPIGLSPGNFASSQVNLDCSLDHARDADDGGQPNCTEGSKVDGKVLIYPMEAVLAPVLPPVPARTYLRRCWLQEWAGTHWLEDSVNAGLNWDKGNLYAGKDDVKIVGVAANGTDMQNSSSSSSSSSGSGGSSIKSSSSRGRSFSSGSSSSSESEVGAGEGEFEADADSFVSKVAGLPVGNASKRGAGLDLRVSAPNLDAAVGALGSKRNRGKVTGLSGEPPNKLVKRSTSPNGEMSALLEGVGNAGARKSGNLGELNIQGSLGIAAGSLRGAGSQVGTPWDWTDEGMGLGMGMGMDMQTDADILAEFGDFGDFFEDDCLHFGEPPGTAESQASMFSDFVDGVNTPGTISMEGPDPMLLPILDFPTLAGFGKQLGPSSKDQSAKGVKITTNEIPQLQNSGQFSPPAATPVVTVDPLAKAEAMILFAPGYARVELPAVKDGVSFSSMYVPESRKVSQESTTRSTYVYSATGPPSKNWFDSKIEQVADHQSQDDFGDSKITFEAGGDHRGFSKQASNVHTGIDSLDCGGIATSNAKCKSHQKRSMSNGPILQDSPNAEDGGKCQATVLKLDMRICPPVKSATPVLATELDCALLQVSMLCAKDGSLASSATRPVSTPPSSGSLRSPVGSVKEENPHGHVDQLGRVLTKPPQAQKKKSLPSRIAGDVDEDVQEGLRSAQVGVWRPVQAPKPQKTSNSMVDSQIGSSSASPDTGNVGLEGGLVIGGSKLNHWQSVIDAIPLLAQQAAVASDVALDGECGDGPLGWLAFQERQRYRGACGPGMSHTGCGGMFSIRHCLDNAGIEYIDPLAAEVSPATVANLLQSDFRVAIAAAFGEANTDGPLTSPDWCRCRMQGDGNGSGPPDNKEGASGLTIAVGESITSPQCIAVNAGGLKSAVGLEDLEQRRGSTVRNMETSSVSDQTRDEAGTSDPESLVNGGSYGAAIVALPVPALLVGYQDDWLKASPNALRLWEKAPLEPYAPPKPVSYYVLCLGLDSLVSAANDFFQQLSAVYETCRLGTHAPATTTPLAGLSSASSTPSAPGFIIVDAPPQSVHLGSASGLIGDFKASMDRGWSFEDFRKALSRVYRTVPVSSNATNVQRDPEQGQCTVVYVVSPSSEPADLLQIMLDASQCLGSTVSERDRRVLSYNQLPGTATEEPGFSPVVGFSTPRLVLQVLPAEVVMKATGSLTSELDILKGIAFCVYSKARRIQRKVVVPESTHPVLSSSRVRPAVIQSGSSMPGMWKDCNTVRNSAVNSVLESGSLRSSWDGGWQSSATRFGDSSITDGGSLVGDLHNNHEASRFLYEPLFILAEPGSPDPSANHQILRSAGKEVLRSLLDDVTGNTTGIAPGLADTGPNTGADVSDMESTVAGNQQAADLHCCYTWTDDWQWLVSVWTDARGELLDISVLPLVGAQKDVSLQSCFTQVLQQGLQLLLMAVEAGSQHQRSIVISRLGGFTERECQEWYRTVIVVGGDEARKWPLHLWPGVSNVNSSMQDMALLSERTLGLASGSSMPPSPSPSSFSARSKSSGMTMNMTRRQGQVLGANQVTMESRGPFQWVNSISLVSVRVEHCLQTVCVSDMAPSSGLMQGTSSGTCPAGSVGNANNPTTGAGISTVKTLASVGASFMLVPSNSLRVISPQPWQLPTVPSPSAPQLAQLLQSSPIAPPLASAFIVSPPTPSPITEFVQPTVKEEWPSTLHVGLIALSRNFSGPDSCLLLESTSTGSKPLKDLNKDLFLEAHRTVQLVAAQVHALSWLTMSPTISLRHSPLPFHCNVAQRLCRLLSYLDVELGYPRHSHTPV